MDSCKHCKHWSKHHNMYEDNPDQWGHCVMTQSSANAANIQGSRAVAEDSEMYSATLRTHETFACNQFKQRQEAGTCREESTSRR